jgi:hypothetical protein
VAGDIIRAGGANHPSIIVGLLSWGIMPEWAARSAGQKLLSG